MSDTFIGYIKLECFKNIDDLDFRKRDISYQSGIIELGYTW